jgi:hypothetical protein
MGHPVIKPGLMFVGSSGDYQGLYIVTKNIRRVILVAASYHSVMIDKEFFWCAKWHSDIYKEVKREDLPLYLNLYHREAFLHLMKGECVI